MWQKDERAANRFVYNDSMSRLEASFLGTYQVILRQQPITHFRSSNNQALLAYLLLESKQPVPRDVLATLFWGEEPEQNARTNLRQALHQLRKILGDVEEPDQPFLLITRQSVQFNHESDYVLDVDQFSDALEAGEQERAIALYQGELLPGFSCDSAQFEEWLRLEREQLHQRALEAMFEAAEGNLQAGRLQEAKALARRQLALEPWGEPAHRQLMQAYALAGDRANAVAQFEACQEQLWQEFSVTPAPQTVALAEDIEAGRFGPAPGAGSEEATPSVAHNLPVASTPFYGREAAIAQLDQLLTNPEVRLITVTGVGGVGKTRLAYEAARRQLTRQPVHFGDGIIALSLTSLDSPEGLAAALAGALDVTLKVPAPDGRSKWQQLIDRLREKELLLLLDDFEHLIEGAPLLGELVRHTVALRLLVTSRERLNLREEHIVPLEGFPAGQGSGSNTGTSAPFWQLFLYAARRARPSLELSAEQATYLEKLHEITAGLPLAVELAASWVDVLPLRQIVAEIEQDIDFLQTDLRDIPQRQRSMRAVFEGSWRRLSPELQDAFAALSLFRDSFSRRGAQAVAGATVRELARLSAKSLLQYEAEVDRYRLHGLLRQFAARKLTEDPDKQTAVTTGYIRYMLALVEECDRGYRRTRHPDWLERLNIEHGNIRAALEEALRREEIEYVGQMSARLGVFWGIRGRLNEGRRWLETVMAHSEKISEETRGRVFFALGWLAFEQGEYATAESYYTSSYDLLADTGATELISEVLSCLGHTAQQQARYEEATALCEESLALYRELGNRGGVASILNRLGRLAELQGDYAQAVILFRESLKASRAGGYERGTASCLNALAEIARFEGEYQRAERLYDEAHAICMKLGDKRCVAGVSHNLAHVALQLGDYRRATALFRESLLLYRELENMEGVALCLAGLGGVLASEGTRLQSVHLLSKASALFERNQVVLAVADKTAFDENVAAARAQVGADDFQEAWAKGRELRLEELLQISSVDQDDQTPS